MREIKIDTYNLGQQFYEDGMRELDKMAYGELEMKCGLLVAVAGRVAVIYAGSPGGAKTLIGANAYRLFDEEDSQKNFVTIPYDSNLQEKEIVGGSITSHKNVDRTTGDKREQWNESSTTNIDALITKDTIGIFVDELTRVNPFALNALLSAPEERKIRTNAGTVDVPKLQVMVSTMNPSEAREATFPVGLAIASRHAVGAIAGNALSDQAAEALQQGNIPDPRQVKAIATIRQLDMLRDTVDTMRLPEHNAKSRVNRVNLAAALMKEAIGVSEKGRLHVQIGHSARILALLRGSDKVNEQDFNQAVRFAMAARIGAKTDDIELAPSLLDEFTKQIVNAT